VEDDEDGLMDVSAIARSAYIIGHIDKLLEVFARAEMLHQSLPKGMRQNVEKSMQWAASGELNETTMDRLAYDFGKYPPELINALQAMLIEVKHYVGVWVDCDDADRPELFGMLDEDDMNVITEMITFVQNLRARSTRHLLQFLEGANEGERGYLLIQRKGKDSEVVYRPRLSADTMAEFDL
jgi:hypothetical protein